MEMSVLRQESIRRLSEFGLPTNPALPLLENALEPRSLHAVVARALALHAVVAAAYGFSRESAKQWIEREGVWVDLTAAERRFLEIATEEPRNFRGRVEALGALGWSLSLIPSCDPFQKLPANFVNVFPDLKAEGRTQHFRKTAQLRERTDLLGLLDLSYCCQWALRHVELTGLKPLKIQPLSVVSERRRAIEWLLSSDDWDDISLDT